MNSPDLPRLRLFIAGGTASGGRALANAARLRAVLNRQIDIVDVLAQPAEAEAAGILATPTLSDDSVAPPRRIIGDLSDLKQIVDFFGCRRKDQNA